MYVKVPLIIKQGLKSSQTHMSAQNKVLYFSLRYLSDQTGTVQVNLKSAQMSECYFMLCYA